MNFLPQLTEEDVHYVCSVIPLQDSMGYFRKNPQEFAKVLPGFRAKGVKKAYVSAQLFRHRNQHFVSSFIEKHISNWLLQIQEHLNKRIEDGESKELAFMHILPYSFFAGNVGLYFKLINEEYTEEFIALMSAAVAAIKEEIDEQDKLREGIRAKERDLKKLQDELKSTESKLERVETNLSERFVEIKTLKRNITDLEKLRGAVQKDKQMIEALKVKNQERENTIKELETELSDVKISCLELETRIRAELETQQAAKIVAQKDALKLKRPRDIEEFKDYLGYNLENIGVPTDSEYFALLKEHLSKILFQGMPIVVNRKVGITLIKCIANTLIGQSNVKTLVFSKDLSIDEVDSFLSSAGRVVCLDNFIGNFNETELLPLFDNHKNKIIFLTVAYDRTINYVSAELLQYCQYLNLNRVGSLSVSAELTEDSSTLEEVEYTPQGLSLDNRYSSLMREMLGEFGVLPSLIERKCLAISDEQSLCRILAFDVLPYSVDVLQVAPYHTSERLIKYAGDAGRCLYKNLLKRWFAR